MKPSAHHQWLIGQAVAVVMGLGLGFAQSSIAIGMAATFLFGVLIDIRHELNLLNEKEK